MSTLRFLGVTSFSKRILAHLTKGLRRDVHSVRQRNPFSIARAGILRLRADDAIRALLLEGVGNPSAHSTDGKRRTEPARVRHGDLITSLGLMIAATVGFWGLTAAHLARLRHQSFVQPLAMVAVGAVLGLTTLVTAYRRAKR